MSSVLDVRLRCSREQGPGSVRVPGASGTAHGTWRDGPPGDPRRRPRRWRQRPPGSDDHAARRVLSVRPTGRARLPELAFRRARLRRMSHLILTGRGTATNQAAVAIGAVLPERPCALTLAIASHRIASVCVGLWHPARRPPPTHPAHQPAPPCTHANACPRWTPTATGPGTWPAPEAPTSSRHTGCSTRSTVIDNSTSSTSSPRSPQ